MARDIINVQYPTLETTQSVGHAKITKTAIDADNGISISKAFSNKNNSLFIFVENTDDEDADLTILAGDAYPNAMLGNLELTVSAETTSVFQIQDISRFENKNGSLNIDFDSGFTGNIYAIAKSTALNN